MNTPHHDAFVLLLRTLKDGWISRRDNTAFEIEANELQVLIEKTGLFLAELGAQRGNKKQEG